MTTTDTTAPQPVQTQQTPQGDPAESILRQAQGVNDDARANAWDAFHQATNEDDLASKLQNMNIPQEVKASLWDAKHSMSTASSAPAPKPSGFAPVADENIPGASAGLPTVPNAAPSMAPTLTDKAVQAAAAIKNAYPGLKDLANEKLVQPFIDYQTGAFKGAGQTAIGLARLSDKVMGGGGIIPGVEPWVPSEEKVDDYLKRITGNPNATLETHGAMQKAGSVAEAITELMWGEGAFKALSWADKAKAVGNIGSLVEKYPRLARILTNSVRAGALGGVQNLIKTSAESPLESLKTAGEFSVGGLLTEGPLTALTTVSKEAAEAGAVPPLQKIFNFLNAPADAAEKARLAAHATESANTAAESAAKFVENQRQFVNDVAQASKASTEGLTGAPLVQALQDDLDKVHQQLLNNYGNALDQFASHADVAGVKVGGVDSPLAKKAQELLTTGAGLPNELQDAMSNITPGLEPAKAMLEQLAKGEPMTWAEASQLQKLLGKKAYAITDYTNPLKRAYTDLKLAVGDSLTEGAEAANQPQLAQNLRDLRSDYATTIGQLQDNAVIRALRNKDLDGVAKLLMSRDTIGDNVTTLRGLLDRIGSTHMEDVQNEIFNHILDKASDLSSGVADVSADKLAANFFKIPEAVRDQIWPSGQLDKFAEALRVSQTMKQAGEATTASAADKAAAAASQAADAKTAVSEANRIFPGLARHPGGALFIGKLAWDVANGNYDKAWTDVKYAVASEVATGALRSRVLQGAILTSMQWLSNVSQNVGVEVTTNPGTSEVVAGRGLASKYGERLAGGPALHAGLPAGNPVGETAASVANAEQVGIPSDATIARPGSNLSTDVLPGRGGIGNQVTVRQGDNVLGSLEIAPTSGEANGKDFVVQNVEVNQAARNQGNGVALYERAIQHLQDQGAQTLSSGSSLSPDAERVWKSLAKNPKYADAITVNDVEAGKGSKYSLDLSKVDGEEDVTNELNQHVAEAKAKEPAPRAANPKDSVTESKIGPRTAQVLKDVRTSGSPLFRSEIGKLLGSIEHTPNSILNLDVSDKGPQIREAVRRVQAAVFADMARGNLDLALAMKQALDAEQ